VPDYAGAENWMAGSEYGFGRTVENRFAVRLVGQLKSAVQQAVAQKQATAKAGLGNLPLGTGPHSGSAAVAQAFAKSILFAYGWTQAQWPYLQALWNQESGWNSYAVNPSSGAYGIPQALGKGHPYNLGDYQAQIRWGLPYISSRYGTPAKAWAHEKAFNWYGNGLDATFSNPTVIGVGERGREHVSVTPGGRPAGGNTYNITVSVPPAANLAEVGRVTVQAIREYERGSGDRWRR
jgi:hypothetical protein